MGVVLLAGDALEDEVDFVCDAEVFVLLVVVLAVGDGVGRLALDGALDLVLLLIFSVLAFNLLLEALKLLEIIIPLALKLLKGQLNLSFLHFLLQNESINLIVISQLIPFQDLVLSMQTFIEDRFELRVSFQLVQQIINTSHRVLSLI